MLSGRGTHQAPEKQNRGCCAWLLYSCALFSYWEVQDVDSGISFCFVRRMVNMPAFHVSGRNSSFGLFCFWFPLSPNFIKWSCDILNSFPSNSHLKYFQWLQDFTRKGLYFILDIRMPHLKFAYVSSSCII